MMGFFCSPERLNFMSSHLLVVGHNACTVASCAKSILKSMNAILFSTFSSIRFRISDLMLRSSIHLDVSFVQGDIDLFLVFNMQLTTIC